MRGHPCYGNARVIIAIATSKQLGLIPLVCEECRELAQQGLCLFADHAIHGDGEGGEVYALLDADFQVLLFLCSLLG